MVSLDDLKDLTLYRKSFFLPIEEKDKRRGSAIMLLTPNYKSSMLAMTEPYAVNKRYFESYYVERVITKLIKNESVFDEEDRGEYIFEQALSSKKRNDLPDSDFGLPKERRYPMPDKKHVLAAIRFFNHVEADKEEELAKNIIKKIKAFDMADDVHVGDGNRFKSYWEKCSLYKKTVNESAVDESCLMEDYEYEEYFNEYVSLSSANEYLGGRLSQKNDVLITFSGYDKDVSEVEVIFKKNKTLVKDAFKTLGLEDPKKLNIVVIGDGNEDEGYEDDVIYLVSKSVFKRNGNMYDYDGYVKYMVYYYAITRLNKKVFSFLAQPAAVVLSGIIPEDTLRNRDRIMFDPLKMEKIFKYVLDTYGIGKVKLILEGNNLNLLLKYATEFSRKPIRESDLGIDSYLIEEEGEDTNDENGQNDSTVGTITSLDQLSGGKDIMPDSLKALKRMGTSLKRKIRRPIYRMNKILRDLERGNNGVENRVMTSIEALKTGDMGALGAAAPTIEGVRLDGETDYVLEGGSVHFFNEAMTQAQYDTQLRKALFSDRIRNAKAVLQMYKGIKADLPFIKYAYADMPRYGRKNVFVDFSYYNEAFFRNIENLNEEDKSNSSRLFSIYTELVTRLIKACDFNGYTKKTIFIPVLDWRHNNSTRMWIYREDVNPISMIFDLIRTNNTAKLKSLFGNNDVVFLGGRNYFKINFGKTSFAKQNDVSRFIALIKRIITLGYDMPADPDPEGEFDSSPKGIAMDIIDKIERSQNVTIDDISKLSSLNKDVDLTSKVPDEVQKDFTVKKIIVKDIDDADQKAEIKSGLAAVTSLLGKSNVPITQAVVTKTATQNQQDIGQTTVNQAVNSLSSKQKKDAIVDAIVKVADTSVDSDEALDKLNTDEFKEMILALDDDSSTNARVDTVRASKIIQTEDAFHEKEVRGKSVKELLKVNPNDTELKKTDLKIASINKGWSELTFMNFDKEYDPDADIMKMLDNMKNWTFPIAVKDITITDDSSSEDLLDLWTIDCIDYKGSKFTIKVDIPRFIEGSNFLKLRGNEKTLMLQTSLVPITKTDFTKCQIIGLGGYNKIFVIKYGERKGQSVATANRLIRALSHYEKHHKDAIKVVSGDCSKICNKYYLPIDYTDVAKYINSIETDAIKFYFNQDELRLEYEVDDTKGIPLGIRKSYDSTTKQAKTTIIYYDQEAKKAHPTLTGYIARLLGDTLEGFSEVYYSINVATAKCSYSIASILSEHIPVIVVCGYLEGLTKTMKKAGIKYEFKQDLDKMDKISDDKDFIKFADGYLVYEVNYSSSLLMNGLKVCDTESYSIKDVNSRIMYSEFLESYGGMIKGDGLENSYDCMIDPITREILEMYHLPTDYVSVLIHANNMIADNKYIHHTDQQGRRWRRKELIAGYFYRALTGAYQTYANQIRHSRKNVKLEMKQDAVINMILSNNPAIADLSVNNAINDVECTNTVTNKGLVGMNSERAYTIDTRGYDESMLNVLGMDTGFSGNVGINRQATIDANISGGRGIIKTTEGTDEVSVTKTLTITEAMIPFGCTHDDPQRTLMSYLQTSKHAIRCDNNDPMLVTTGADEALPYLTSNIFAYKARKDGRVVERIEEGPYNDNYMIVEYKDGTHAYINLSEEIKKNSDGGYYVPMKLDTELKVGHRFKEGEVLAYDKSSFAKSLGESGNLAATMGTLAKVAIINTDEGFEDSAAITESFAKKIGTQVIQTEEIVLDKGSNIFLYKNLGDPVHEGETIMAYQKDFDDDTANILLKNLTIDKEKISELGRNPVVSAHTGILEGIDVYRTAELDELSESLRELCLRYESVIKRRRSTYHKYNIDDAMLPPTTKLPMVGKTKNVEDGVKIVFYIKYTDTMSVGDKIVYYSANKGIIKTVIPKEEEPYTEFRPHESVDSFMSLSSISGRMTCSITLFTAVSKLMVELDRSVKDLAGIPWDDTGV